MVAITGYTVEMFFFMAAITYVLIVMYGIVRVMNAVIGAEFEGELGVWGVILTSVGLLVIISAVYYFPVKIGLVMFVNGVLTTLIGFELKRLLSRWSPFSVGVVQDGKEISQ